MIYIYKNGNRRMKTKFKYIKRARHIMNYQTICEEGKINIMLKTLEMEGNRI